MAHGDTIQLGHCLVAEAVTVGPKEVGSLTAGISMGPEVEQVCCSKYL